MSDDVIGYGKVVYKSGNQVVRSEIALIGPTAATDVPPYIRGLHESVALV